MRDWYKETWKSTLAHMALTLRPCLHNSTQTSRHIRHNFQQWKENIIYRNFRRHGSFLEENWDSINTDSSTMFLPEMSPQEVIMLDIFLYFVYLWSGARGTPCVRGGRRHLSGVGSLLLHCTFWEWLCPQAWQRTPLPTDTALACAARFSTEWKF